MFFYELIVATNVTSADPDSFWLINPVMSLNYKWASDPLISDRLSALYEL